MRWALIGLAAAALAVTAVLAARNVASDPPAAPQAAKGVFGGDLEITDGGPAVVWAVGDGATGSDPARTLAERIAADDPDRVLYLGDVYDTGTAAEFRDNFGGVYAPLVERTLPTPGNHDWPLHEQGYDPFWEQVTSVPTPSWYALRIGNWQVLSLNSQDSIAAGSKQLRWLERRLREPVRCRLAFWHRPRFSAATHGDQEDIAPLWDAVAGRAALVLNGHEHDVQRFEPIDDTVEIVVGSGGASFYPVNALDERLAFSADDVFAAARLELDDASAVVSIVDSEGKELDQTVVGCPSPPSR